MQVHGVGVAVLVLACAAGSATAEGRAGVIAMDAEEARREFDGALLQVRERFVKQQIDALVAQGIADAGDRDRLKSLQAVLAALRSRGGEPPH